MHKGLPPRYSTGNVSLCHSKECWLKQTDKFGHFPIAKENNKITHLSIILLKSKTPAMSLAANL